ncbi:MAG TPA: NUDIX hydrolase [Patescibacteria group bacterium]|nr:NUDIX hydrolase [Patescibacteria group bacterium]
MVESPIYNPQTNKNVAVLPYTAGSSVREYITSTTGEAPSFNRFIEDDAYKEALSGLVIDAVDVMAIDPDTGRMLLATRDQEPHPGDWIIGGRKRAGESDVTTAVGVLKRELKLKDEDIDPSALIPVGKHYKLVWDTRSQPSSANEKGETVTGCHMISTLMVLPLREGETDFNEEYSGMRWVDPEEITAAEPGTYHPCLVDMVGDAYERLTRPDASVSLEDAHLRAVGQLATIEAQMRATSTIEER